MGTSQILAITHDAAPVRVSPNNHKLKKTLNYRGVIEESGASRAQQQTGKVRLPGVTGNTPAPTVARLPGVTGNTPAPTAVRLPGVTGNTTAPTTNVKNKVKGAALRSLSVNVMGERNGGTSCSFAKVNPARGLLTHNREKRTRRTKSGSTPPPNSHSLLRD